MSAVQEQGNRWDHETAPINHAARDQPARFVIFCDVRSGSYALVSRLDSAEDIICHGEVFHHEHLDLRAAFEQQLGVISVQERNADKLAYIKRLQALSPYKHFGFKVLRDHFDQSPELADYVSDPSIKRIILWRDPIESYGSLLRSLKTNIWMVKNPANFDAAALREKVMFSPESFSEFSKSYNQFIETSLALSKIGNSFVLRYDQINHPPVIAALLRFIGSEVRAEETSSRTYKQFPGSVRDGFANWSELRTHLWRDRFLAGPAPTVQP